MKIDIPWELIQLALKEDLGVPYRDITTQLLFEQNKEIKKARNISKNHDPIVLCGLPFVSALLKTLHDQGKYYSDYDEGSVLRSGECLLTLEAPANTLLMIERTLLNFLQHLCAVATHTARFVQLVSHTSTKILDTRKTIPGFRHLDKYAVQCGGGVNHRMGLYDAIMMKDTHVDCLGGMAFAIDKLPDNILQQYPVIVEVRNKEELNIVLEKGSHKITRVLLDNMSLEELTNAVNDCRGKIQTEASGNVSLQNVSAIAETGVDFISIGQLTHSPLHVDLSMRSTN